MPGIVGLVTKMPRERAERELRRMVEAISHEPSYVVGTLVDESLGVYVGWAARKGCFADCNPLCSERGDVALVFSGEEFPEPGTADRLKRHGHQLAPGAASYLVHLYEDDPLFPEGLNGRFHGFLIDRRRRTGMLFNDRYGMHRVYYHEAKESFYFAAEAKAILAVRPELRRIDDRSLGEFVSCGCVLENRTLFDRVHVLEGGARWIFEDASPRKTAYFRPLEWESQPPLDHEAYYQEIRRIFSQNLPRYFETEERIGMSLTGGLDTRMIMASRTFQPNSLPCYSFGSTYRDCQDVLVGRQVAAAAGQRHEVIEVGREFLSRFADYAERTVFLTDGCADVGRSPDLYVNEKARSIAPVRMTGNYGGEVLRRVRAFKPMEPLPGLFRPEFMEHVRQAEGTYSALLQGHPLSFAVFKQAPWHHYGLLALEQTQLSLRSPYLDNDFVRTVFRAPESASVNNDVCLRLIAEGTPDLRRIRTDRGLGGDRGPLSSSISKAVLEFLFKAEYAYDYGMPQSVARIDHSLSFLHLERLFLGRHKFIHFRVWYRDTLAKDVKDILLDPKALSRSYLEPRRVETVVASHARGQGNYTSAIHKLMTLELLHRCLLEPNRTHAPRSAAGA